MLRHSAVLLAVALSVRASLADEGLKATWGEADHASGIYFAKGTASLNVTVENGTDGEFALDGEVAFGQAPGKGAEFKAISVTPITAALVGAHQRAKISLKVEFGAAGLYELRWTSGEKATVAVENAAGVKLQAIFAPRDAKGPEAGGRWITNLPRQAGLVAGYIEDYAAQTSVRRFVLDERFGFDPTTHMGLGMGASLGLTVEQLDGLFVDAGKAGAGLVLRVKVPLGEKPEARSQKPEERVAAFRQYLAEGIRRARGTVKGIVVVPEVGKEMTEAGRVEFRAFYLAGYEEAKKLDKAIVMLGAGTAAETRELLGGNGKDAELMQYVDALAIGDAVEQPAAGRRLLGEKKPIWILPPAIGQGGDGWNLIPAAAALAEGAAVVPAPPPAVDRGVTGHLLGGVALLERVHPESLPYVAVFQGDGYGVAAVAGLSANTPLDGQFPALARGKTSVTPPGPADADDERPPYPNLEVADDNEQLRVVDAAGTPIECRTGDTLYVPAADHVVYVLASGSAEDLAALLRQGTPNRLPMVEIDARAVEGRGISLKLTNISTEEVAGKVRLIEPKSKALLGEHAIAATATGKSLDVEFPVDEVPAGPVVVEVESHRGVQRTAVVLTKAR